MHNNSGPTEIYVQEIYVFEVPDLAKTMYSVATADVYSGNADKYSIFQYVDWSLNMDYTATFSGGAGANYIFFNDGTTYIDNFAVIFINNESTHTSSVILSAT